MEGSSGTVYDLDNLDVTELRLGLPGTNAPEKTTSRGCKRSLVEEEEPCHPRDSTSGSGSVGSSQEDAPPAKTQVVGWPPVRSYRMRMTVDGARIYVKVSMDGAPYLRKIDLKLYQGYKELREALEEMFQGFTIDELDAKNGFEYAITYEDKDGDWMLVGDVPWEMFISSCKRLRIMRGNEARGLRSGV